MQGNFDVSTCEAELFLMHLMVRAHFHDVTDDKIFLVKK